MPGQGTPGHAANAQVLPCLPALTQVYAEAWGTDITTAGAAGYWEPFKLSDTPPADIHRRARARAHAIATLRTGEDCNRFRVFTFQPTPIP